MADIEFIGSAQNRQAWGSASNIAVATRAGIRFGLYNLGKDLKKTINKEILDKKSKRGIVYIVRGRRGQGRKRKHRSSAPGQTAANITGDYRRSVGYNVSGTSFLEFGASAEYAKFLELGTKRMAARPGLRNAMLANQRNGTNRIQQGIAQKLGPAFR